MSTINVTNLAGPSNTGTAALLASVNGGPISGARNRIINGDMRIDQRNAGASVTPSTTGPAYLLDRFGYYNTQVSRLSYQQNAGSVTPPVGFTNYLGATVVSAATVGGSDAFVIYQPIEGLNTSDLAWGTANALPVTLSFWVRSSLTGTFSGSLANSGNTRSRVFSYTISQANTWEFKSVTIPGDTTGTWLTTNGIGIQVSFSLGAGSSFSATPGSWVAGNATNATGGVNLVATNGATFYITGVQLEAGTVATPFERRSYGQELALCQRYYQIGTYPPSYNGGNTQADYVTSFISFKQTMRVVPTMSIATHIYADSASFTGYTVPQSYLAPGPYTASAEL